MDAVYTRLRDRHLLLLQTNLKIFDAIVRGANPADLTAKRDASDGDAGWTPTEIVCHMRDLEPNFITRARSVVETDHPAFLVFDVARLAVERAYNQQDIRAALAEWAATRADLLAYFSGVTDDQWLRAGVHPERGEQTLLDVLMHIGHHDIQHIEQITRVLAQ